jgi:cyanate permease
LESPSSSSIASETKLREPRPATRRLISHIPVQFFGPVLIGGLLLSFLNLIFYSTIGWLPTYLSEQGWHPTSAATVTSVISFSEIPAVVLMPMISDQMGKRRMIIFSSFLLMAACSAIVSLWPSLCWFLSPVFGLAFGGVFALLLALPVEIVEVHEVGRAAGAILSIGYTGALVGPPLTGFLRDMTGLFGVGFMVLMIAGIVAAGLSYALPERTCSRP